MLISAGGQPFAKRGGCIAGPVTLNELPQHFIDAVLAREDRRFYSHIGIDPRGILRAASRNYRAGVIREGGSTITQQLAKISFLTGSKTFRRKLEEALLAMWLEKRLTKNQILERYLSSAYFGKGCFGVRAAARYFFDKPVGELNVSESALLVALLRSPVRFSANLDEARKDARLVVRAMVRDGGSMKKALLTSSPQNSLRLGRTGRRLLCRWARRLAASGDEAPPLPVAGCGLPCRKGSRHQSFVKGLGVRGNRVPLHNPAAVKLNRYREGRARSFRRSTQPDLVLHRR